MKKNFISLAFIGIIFLCLVSVIVKQGLITLHVIEYYKDDNWQIVEKSNDPIKDKILSVEKAIENRMNNYFPGYQLINRNYYNLMMDIDSLYLKDSYLKKNKDDEYLFYNNVDNFYYIVNNYSKEELHDRVQEYVNYYNELASKYSDIKIGIYLPLRFELTNNINIPKNYELVNEFINGLSTDIYVRTLDSLSVSEYLNYFYKTDHHYNDQGGYLAYNDILDMFEKNKITNIKYKEVYSPYYGAYAKSVLSYKIQDDFKVMDVDNGLNVNIEDKHFKPLEMNKRDNIFYDYYVGFFNGQYDEIIYNNDIDSNDNLLIIGDSYAWQIDYMLAKSFKNTYVINLRYGKWIGNNVDLEAYIQQNNITHILFLQEAKATMFDGDNIMLSKRVK